jgi:hypothetical protein
MDIDIYTTKNKLQEVLHGILKFFGLCHRFIKPSYTLKGAYPVHNLEPWYMKSLQPSWKEDSCCRMVYRYEKYKLKKELE